MVRLARQAEAVCSGVTWNQFIRHQYFFAKDVKFYSLSDNRMESSHKTEATFHVSDR